MKRRISRRRTETSFGLLLTLLGCLVLSACGSLAGQGPSSSESKAAPGSRSAEEVFVEFLDTMDDVVKQSGTTWPGWDRNDTADYVSEVCPIHAREDGLSYQRQIEGGPIADPPKAAGEMKAYWKSKSYKIGNEFDDGDPASGVQLNATTPTGVFIQFSPTPHGSFIKVVGVCTLDPAAKRKTK